MITTAKNLRKKALDELKDERERMIVEQIKAFEKRIKNAKAIVKNLEKNYSDLLDTDINKVDLNDFKY